MAIDRRIAPAYGGIWAENQSANLTLVVINDWYKFDDFEANFNALNCTPDFSTGKITIDATGNYCISLGGSPEFATVAEYQVAVFVNGFRNVALTNKIIRLATNANRQRVSTGGGGVALSANDEVEVYVRCNDVASAVVRQRDLSLSLKRLS